MSSDLKDPIVLVPAAGRGQRFRDQGFAGAKPMLHFSLAGDVPKTMLSHAMKGTGTWNRVIGAPSEHFAEFERNFGAVNSTVISVAPNGGQLDTINALLEFAPYETPILILNSDVSFRGSWLKTLHWLCSAYAETGIVSCGALVVRRDKEEDEAKYSYVNEIPLFDVARERQMYSSWALAGAYWFRSKLALQQAIVSAKMDPPSYGSEHYLSQVYEFLSGTGLVLPVPDDDYLEFGTPELLQQTISRFK